LLFFYSERKDFQFIIIFKYDAFSCLAHVILFNYQNHKIRKNCIGNGM